MNINKIVIACFKKDLFLLRTCVASIRFWYPNAEIYLLKDVIQGDFSLNEFEKYWNCKIFPSETKEFGWPWSKLAVIFHPEKERFLFLDSDIVLLGKVLDKLNKFNEDFIVTGVIDTDKGSHNINAHYIDMKKMEQFDDAYQYPGFAFNGGQIVMTGGILTENDFNTVINFRPAISNRYPEIFKHGDQGALNYLFAKAQQEGKIKLRYDDFWIWPGISKADEIDINEIKEGTGYPYVMHWAGAKPVDFRKYLRYDLLQFYEKIYYQKIPFGQVKQTVDFLFRLFIVKVKILKYKLFRQKYV